MEKQKDNNVDELTRKLLENNQRQLEKLQEIHDDARYKELVKNSRNSIKNLFRRI